MAETVTEYEHLAAKKRQRRGNAELATVTDVAVGRERVVLTATFEWAPDPVRLSYDLDADRDVLKLERLTETAGFDFEQVAFLEGESIELTYTGDEWVPSAHRAQIEGAGSASETFRTELRLLTRELARAPNLPRRGIEAMRTASTRQLVVGVILVKKLLIAGLLVWLLV
ncbi:hypothetical protein BV210_13370 [Halorientalis sp. IM1011]|uniref:hypothetical protein n=1 Tax=Halorientalis sp. IM1011 TaxID=1932360 RepID=UPI00097CCDBB|nr:hypothetical protein [Halorientalis sp. IM1011]AQL43627.1 hypothetical protein BV210_13370 [Halorientalis sp. IM1011]